LFLGVKMPDTNGNTEQIRIVAQAVADSTADTTIKKFVEMHPDFGEIKKAQIPESLKLWGTIGAALLVLGIGGTATWVVTSIGDMKDTLARMDERQILLGPIQEKRFADLETNKLSVENRLSTLERGKNVQAN
jgi:hypothetical protein